MRFRHLLLGTVLLVPLVPAPAHAVGPGAPGKVAVTSPGQPLRVWDPVQAAKEGGGPDAGFTEIAPLGAPPFGQKSLARPSRPQWSPDGTKLAFVRLAVDPGNRAPAEPADLLQSSIYVWTVATGETHRVTTPAPRLWDEDDDALNEGHLVNDFAPTWSDDGQTIAFLRDTDASHDDELYGDNGVQLWTVPAGGGTGTRRTSLDPADDPNLESLATIPGTGEVLAGALDDDYVVFRLPITGGALEEVPGTRGVDFVLPTLDVSPDGTRFSRSEIVDGTFAAAVRRIDGRLIARKPGTDGVAFSPTGNGAIGRGCVAGRCGMVETLGFADDAPRDTGGAEQRLISQFPYANSGGLVAVQPQELPIVFLPGFLGSEIACNGSMQWPRVRADTLGMRLGTDGKTNVGCAGTAPTGKAIGSFLGTDVYASISAFLEKRFGARASVLGWDWRKRAEESWDELDAEIERLLARDSLGKRQGVGRVVLWGHSYGGLLARSYLAWHHPEKVAQVLSVGSPFLGSPKPVFPLAFGVESPGFSGFDLLFDNDDMKVFARDLAGLYELLPSPAYPEPWVSIDGQGASAGAVVDRLGGNASLLRQAQDDHKGLFDGFYDDDGRVDVRAVVGTGMATVTHIDLRPRADEDDQVVVRFGNGDQTVPGVSANQGPLGTTDPLGDDIRVQHQCDVDHVALANDPAVLEAYGDWADVGAVPKRLRPAPCPVAATELSFEPGEIDDPARRSDRADAPPTLTAAEQAGRVDVLRLPRETLVVSDDRRPVTWSAALSDATFRATRIGPDGAERVVEYGPVSGEATFGPAAEPGAPPVVTVGGTPVEPREVGVTPVEPGGSGGGGGGTPDGGGGGTSAGGPGGGGSTGAGASGGGGAIGGGTGGETTTTGSTGTGGTGSTSGPARKPASAPLQVIGSPSLRGRRLTFRARLTGAGTLRTTASSGKRTLGRRTTTVKRPGTVTVRVTLRRTVRSARVVLAFSPTRGAVHRTTRTVRRR